MVTKQLSDALASYRLDDSPTLGFGRDEPDRPARAPFRWGGAYHRDDLRLMTLCDLRLCARALAVVERELHPAQLELLPGAANRGFPTPRRGGHIDRSPAVPKELEDPSSLRDACGDGPRRQHRAQVLPLGL